MADSGYVGFFDASNHSKTDFYVVGRSLRPVAVAYDPVTKVFIVCLFVWLSVCLSVCLFILCFDIKFRVMHAAKT